MSAVPMSSLLRALLRRPGLWIEAIAAAVAMTPRRWWLRIPPLPRPDQRYVDWRIATAYGSKDGPVNTEDVLAYLQWRKLQRSRVR